MKSVYLDNAATTPMLPEVIEVIQQSMQTNFEIRHPYISMVEKLKQLLKQLERV